MAWNPCPPSRGIRAHHPVESVPTMAWNTHTRLSLPRSLGDQGSATGPLYIRLSMGSPSLVAWSGEFGTVLRTGGRLARIAWRPTFRAMAFMSGNNGVNPSRSYARITRCG